MGQVEVSVWLEVVKLLDDLLPVVVLAVVVALEKNIFHQIVLLMY